MSMFMASMRKELRERGGFSGLGGLSSAAWKIEVEEYERRLRLSSETPTPGDGAGHCTASTKADSGMKTPNDPRS